MALPTNNRSAHCGNRFRASSINPAEMSKQYGSTRCPFSSAQPTKAFQQESVGAAYIQKYAVTIYSLWNQASFLNQMGLRSGQPRLGPRIIPSKIDKRQ